MTMIVYEREEDTDLGSEDVADGMARYESEMNKPSRYDWDLSKDSPPDYSARQSKSLDGRK